MESISTFFLSHSILFQLLTIITWSVVYILVIISGFRSKKIKKTAMPYVAGVLNFSYEIAALTRTRGFGFIGYLIWFFLDLFIVYWGFTFLKTNKKKVLYTFGILLGILTCLFAFEHHKEAFLFLVYLIDVIMAVDFLVNFKKISSFFKLPIAIARLVGDICAGLSFGFYRSHIAVMAIMSLLLNITYFIWCVIEHKRVQTAKGKQTRYNVQRHKKKKRRRK